MSDKEKKEYNDMAEEDKKRYDEEMEEFNKKGYYTTADGGKSTDND